MRLAHLFWLTGAILFVPVLCSAEPFRYPEGKHGKGELKYLNGLPVLTVSGSPAEIGEAIGVLALRSAGPMISYPEDLLKHFHLGFLVKRFTAAGTTMARHFPADYQQELDAMASGGEIDRDKLILGNTIFDLKKSVACSAILVEKERSATNHPLMGRNLDYPSLGYAHEYSLVTVCHPDGARHAFASVGFPGLVGCLSGINDAGLSVAILEVFQIKAGHKRLDPSGLPYALCYRRILENCGTIEEARQLLESMPRTTITNLAVADRDGVAVFEVTPRCVRPRTASNGICVSTNHFLSPDIRPLVRLNLTHTTNRFKALEQPAHDAKLLDLAAVRHILDEAHMSSTLQSMIFEPSERRLHLSIGVCPATSGEMKTLDLAPLFEAVRP